MTIPRSKPSLVAIIPFYNGSEFIARSLASVYAQTVPFDEVIVVNDGSTDDERARLEEIARPYGCLIFHKENGGQGSARNVGVVKSSADFICFLDQDDFFLDTHVQTLLEAVPRQDPRLGFVYGDVYEADRAGRTIRMAMIKNLATDHPKWSVFEMIGGDMFVLPSAALISRRAFEAVQGFDEQFMGYEDDDLFLRMFRAGYTNYFIDKAVTAWCIHTASTSFGIRMSRSRFRYFKKLVAEFPDEPLRGHFYLRDYLVPRFGRLFVNDLIKAKKMGRDGNYQEVSNILDAYGEIVMANPYVASITKLWFRFTTSMLRGMPVWLLLGIFRAVDGRVLIRLRRLFH